MGSPQTSIIAFVVILVLGGLSIYMRSPKAPQETSNQEVLHNQMILTNVQGSQNSQTLDSGLLRGVRGSLSNAPESAQSLSPTNMRRIFSESSASNNARFEYEDFDVQAFKRLGLADFFQKLYAHHTIFDILGAYDISFDKYDVKSYPWLSFNYNPTTIGLVQNNGYCTQSDNYKLNHPEVVFEQLNILTSITYMPADRNLHAAIKKMPNATVNEHSYWFSGTAQNRLENHHNMLLVAHFDVGDIAGFTNSFGCITQLFSHHTHSYLLKKHFLPPMMTMYADKHASKPEKCFQKDDLAPPTYRLYNKKECKEFMRIIKSDEYRERVKVNPNQYIIKPGSDSVQGDGIYLLNDEKILKFQEQLGIDGEKCGEVYNNNIVQLYLSNPLLLKGKKFDFRIYLNVVSEAPLIADYHDGYIRRSLFKYDPNSNDRKQHLTNNVFAERIIEQMKKTGETYEGLSPQELAEESIWTLEEMQSYLLEAGIIQDKNWLENYLRPEMKRIMVHTMKMLQPNFAKNTQTFEWLGFDFMMTDDLKLWLIEINDYPSHEYLRGDVFHVDLWIKRLNIQLAYYRSRMKRVFNLLKDMKVEYENYGFIEIEKYRRRYQQVNKNFLDPEFEGMVTRYTDFANIINENLQGSERYAGLIEPECMLDDDQY